MKIDTAKLKKFAELARRNLIEQTSAKLKLVLTDSSAARRESPEAIKKLESAINEFGNEQVIERVAYIWFNRFCALRFMDVNRYTRIGVVSPTEGQFQPEILAEAKMGHMDEDMVPDKTRQQIFALLDGKVPSRDPQSEAYRLLVVAACNFWNKAMPFLFQYIEDYTELLMPDDLLSENSILSHTRDAMTMEACEDVEIIGWLYQFYISEKKAEVFNGLKKNKKITPENIPAATQLFTPHWIVRYLVENSLGRLWLLNRPNSKLAEQMDYYIRSEQQETDFLEINKPEDIKICDPACGSGHMLTYAFDLLYAIYEEEGYEPADIPEKILKYNLYGIEIDERAGELAAFALTMKARAKHRRFFNKDIKPNICVLENVHFEENELNEYMGFIGHDIFTAPFKTTIRQFEEADNFGSLIRPEVSEVGGIFKILASKDLSNQLFLSYTHQKTLQALKQADYLSPKYHVLIANPPYMGGKGMNGRLASWIKDHYPDSKSDIFSAFIERGLELVFKNGLSAMVTMESWMFLTSFEKLRTKLLDIATIQSMVHMPYLGKGGTSMGINFGTTAFVAENVSRPSYAGQYSCVRYYETDVNGIPNEFPTKNERWTTASAEDFKKIPGNQIAYWLGKTAADAFSGKPIGDILKFKQGIATSDNERFLRFWHEVNFGSFDLSCANPKELKESSRKWFPYNKGGAFRKWFGNNEIVVDWENNGEEMKAFTATLSQGTHVRLKSREYYCLPSLTYTALSSGSFGCRISDSGFLFDTKGSCVFGSYNELLIYSGLLNSKISKVFLDFLCPTLDYSMVGIKQIPVLQGIQFGNFDFVKDCAELSRNDWNSYETSWGFTSQSLLNSDYHQPTLIAAYQKLRAHWHSMMLKMQHLEEENNRIFIDAYGMQDELTPEVSLKEITLTCNPHYRYGGKKTTEELEEQLLADTLQEFISYAVGCMFGRYSLEQPGLILANQGETIEDYLKLVPEPSFPADEDNVIPMLDGDWFTDDIAERFRQFLRITFGEENYEENIKFVEHGLNIKNKRNYSIRDYFLTEFYNDHLKRYKKRPIYWLFSSPKGSFNALIYMHRYRPDTASVVLNDYLREFRTKLASQKKHLEAVSITASSSQAEKTKALKEIEKIAKTIAELEDYERDVLYPLATQQVEIDLDDGVKVNYPKFGTALKKIAGLEAKE